MASNIASDLASVVQSTHIQHQPDPRRDINPSTAASEKTPAILTSQHTRHNEDDLDELDEEDASSTSSSTLPSDIIRPQPRQTPGRKHMPLPDLRFEQTYLASIKNCTSNYQIAYITIRDQLLFPLAQGIGYHLIISGWRFWNRGVKFRGEGIGARVRKWWWGVNGWRLPKEATRRTGTGVEEFVVDKFGSSMGD